MLNGSISNLIQNGIVTEQEELWREQPSFPPRETLRQYLIVHN